MLNRPPTLFGRLKENCEDFLFGLEDEFTGMFPSTKESILADIRRTRDAARENYTQATRRLRAEISEIKKDVKEEASEELDELVQQYRNFRRSIAKKGAALLAEEEEETDPAVIVPTDSNYIEQIRRYESDVRSNVFVTDMNKLVEESLPSPEELRAYYESRPELTEYTIKKELHRMAYAVFTHDGKKLTDPAEIEAYQATEYFQQQQEQAEGATSTTATIEHQSADTAAAAPVPADNNEILWRAANQSLLGDIIVALTSRTGLIRPQLEAATFVNDLTMVLDFAREQPFAQAECFMNLSIPGQEGERLSLAGVLVNVYFCPEGEKFKARISHVFPSATLCVAQVNGAARSLS